MGCKICIKNCKPNIKLIQVQIVLVDFKFYYLFIK